MITVKHPVIEEEREIFPLNRPPEQKEKKKRSFRVSVFDVFVECFKGKGFVEITVDDDEDLFVETNEFETINVKEEDI